MRVLVIGATGYVGSRVIPALLDAGHEVRAGARDTSRLRDFWWCDRIEPVQIDVLDEDSARSAIAGDLDAVVYLVHGMAGDDFADADHAAAVHTRDAVAAAGIPRVVYVSGIIPDVAEEKLSEHLRSRLDVERTLSQAPATVMTLRAAMVFGGGSTSFELMRQLAERLPVTVVPDWMEHRVEPIAVVDVAHAIVAALSVGGETRHFDLGGGEPILYPDLITLYTELSGIERRQLTVGLLPQKLVAQVASWIADIPSATVKALMASLQHDMTAADHRWLGELVGDGYTPVSTPDAIRRALAGAPDDDTADADRDPLQPLSSDPDWAS